MRRVKDKNAPPGQDELFTACRYHAVFTDNPQPLLAAEAGHRDHAVIEQVIADLSDGPLAHLPSGSFAASAAWLNLAALPQPAPRRRRARVCLPRQARGDTLRRQLITIPARLARRGRGHITLHLPEHWPWQAAWAGPFDATHRAPPALAA